MSVHKKGAEAIVAAAAALAEELEGEVGDRQHVSFLPPLLASPRKVVVAE